MEAVRPVSSRSWITNCSAPSMFIRRMTGIVSDEQPRSASTLLSLRAGTVSDRWPRVEKSESPLPRLCPPLR